MVMAAPVSVVRSPSREYSRARVIAARSDLVADEDGHRHGAAHGDHVDDTGEIERCLMRRDGFCAEFRDEYDDEAEEARFMKTPSAFGMPSAMYSFQTKRRLSVRKRARGP